MQLASGFLLQETMSALRIVFQPSLEYFTRDFTSSLLLVKWYIEMKPLQIIINEKDTHLRT